MANSAEVGALRVRLAMDAGEFRRGAKDAEGITDRLARNFGINEKSITRAGTVMTAAMVGAVTAIAVAVTRALGQINKLGRATEVLGASSEQLSRLGYAATVTGVGLDTLTAASTSLSKSLFDIANGDKTSEAARALSAMGISATDSAGNVRQFDAVLIDIAGKFQTYSDGAGKAALASSLFGSAGASMLPLLNQGAGGIRTLTAESDKLGATLSSKTAAAAAQFGTEVNRLLAAGGAFNQQLAAALLPTLQFVADKFISVTKESGLLEVAIAAIDATFKGLVFSGVVVKAVFDAVGATLTQVSQALIAAAQGNFQQAWDLLKTNGQQLSTIVLQVYADFNRLYNGIAKGGAAAAGAMAGTVAPPVIQSLTDIADAARKTREETQMLMDDINNSPTEPLEEKQLRLNALYNEGRINQKQNAEGHRKAAEIGRQSMDALLSTTSQTLGAIFKESKAAAIAQALINTYQGISRAIASYPPPYSYAMAGLQAAMGFAQVASIRSTSEKSSGGGSSSVGSAAGAVAAAPSEGSGGGSSSTLFVQGISSGQMFTAEAVRDLAGRLLDFQRDGGKVVLS
jgi:hypothetical protein